MTTSVTPELSRIEDLFETLVWNSLVEAGLAALFSAMPGLAVWPLGPIIRWVVRNFAEKLYQALKLAIDLHAIAFLNADHRKSFDSESLRLKVITIEKGVNSPEYLEAKEKAKLALSKFVRYTGAA